MKTYFTVKKNPINGLYQSFELLGMGIGQKFGPERSTLELSKKDKCKSWEYKETNHTFEQLEKYDNKLYCSDKSVY